MGSVISTSFYLQHAAPGRQTPGAFTCLDPTGSNAAQRPKVGEKGKAARPFIHQQTHGAVTPLLPPANH